MASDKPWIRVKFNPEKLRVGLVPIATRRVFCVYKAAKHPTKHGKAVKYPYIKSATGDSAEILKGGYDGADFRRRLWTLDEAISVAQQMGFDGVGIAFHPGCGLMVVDLDNTTKDGTTVLTPKQRRVVELLKAVCFAERSMSSEGRHLIVMGDAPTVKAVGDGIEVFGDRNFVALTGDGAGVVDEAPPEAIAEVLRIVAECKGEVRAEKRDADEIAQDCGRNWGADALTINADVAAANYPEPTAEMVRSALGYVSADCNYEQWRNIVWAIKDGLGDTDEALEIADEWSQTAPHRYKPDAVEAVWNSDREGV